MKEEIATRSRLSGWQVRGVRARGGDCEHSHSLFVWTAKAFVIVWEEREDLFLPRKRQKLFWVCFKDFVRGKRVGQVKTAEEEERGRE